MTILNDMDRFHHHSLHPHGHFFRVIHGQGNRSPLKHTVDVEPLSTTVIQFMPNGLKRVTTETGGTWKARNRT